MLLVATGSFLAIACNGEVPADAGVGTEVDMRVDARVSILASASVGKVKAERHALRSRLMRQGANRARRAIPL